MPSDTAVASRRYRPTQSSYGSRTPTTTPFDFLLWKQPAARQILTAPASFFPPTYLNRRIIMKFTKQLILTTAALSVAGAIGFAYSQTSTDTTQPPATSGQGTDARAPDTTTPANPAATTQPSTPPTSGSTMDSGSTAASSGNTATTPSNNSSSTTMGSEQVARADRN